MTFFDLLNCGQQKTLPICLVKRKAKNQLGEMIFV